MAALKHLRNGWLLKEQQGLEVFANSELRPVIAGTKRRRNQQSANQRSHHKTRVDAQNSVGQKHRHLRPLLPTLDNQIAADEQEALHRHLAKRNRPKNLGQQFMASVTVLKFWCVRQNHQTGKQKTQGIEVVIFIAKLAHGVS